MMNGEPEAARDGAPQESGTNEDTGVRLAADGTVPAPLGWTGAGAVRWTEVPLEWRDHRVTWHTTSW